MFSNRATRLAINHWQIKSMLFRKLQEIISNFTIFMIFTAQFSKIIIYNINNQIYSVYVKRSMVLRYETI